MRPAVRRLLRPGPSLAVWAGLLWFWHVPVVYNAALAHEPLHVLEHGSFIAGGLLLRNVLVDPAGRRPLSLFGSLGIALVAMLVALLVLSYRPLYTYGSATEGWPVPCSHMVIRTEAGERKRVSVSTVAVRSLGADPFVLQLLRNGDVAEDDRERSKRLTVRQLEGLRLLADGVPAKLIAQRLGIKEVTVRNHI